jgi:hypothetical protein
MPVQDYRLHVRAWQHHFAAIFGLEALGRVRGFSPAEMALPNHPDVAYEFVKTVNDCGYQWLLVQEHTVELPDARPLQPRGRRSRTTRTRIGRLYLACLFLFAAGHPAWWYPPGPEPVGNHGGCDGRLASASRTHPYLDC